MYFFYDNTGAPIAFWYFPKGGARVTGYYFTNAQGDVTRIEDPNGNVLATYAYDAWGRNYSASGSMQNINPLRYRGYYQDAETNFYYLQSRYYDPSIARFINADSYASTGQGFLGYNMFAYCGNDPVNRVDADGNKYTMIEDFGGKPNGSDVLNKAIASTKSSTGKSSHDANRRPNTGEPGSTFHAPNGDTRTFGPNRKPKQDYDHDDHGHPESHPHDKNGGHYHDWENGVRGPAYVDWEPSVGDFVVGGLLIISCGVGIVLITIDDASVVGVFDNFLYGPLGVGINEGIALILN